MQINKETIIKNLNAILSALAIVGLVLPFGSVSSSADVMGVSAEVEPISLNGIDVVKGVGLWGILFILGVIAVLAFNYVKQIGIYKKIASLIGSAVMIISVFLMAKGMGAAASAGGEMADSAMGDMGNADIEIAYAFGFWIILLCSLALTFLAVVNFFNLKGNAVFDAINNGETVEGEITSFNMNFGSVTDKISDLTKNVQNTVAKSQQGSRETSTPSSTIQTTPPTPQPIVQQTIATEDNSDYIMDKIEKLFEMKEKGILTEEEFIQKKSELLEKIQY